MQGITNGLKDIQQSQVFNIDSNFMFVSTFEHPTTSEENLEGLFYMSLEHLQDHPTDDDLTLQEIADIKKYRDGVETTKRFKNVKDFLEDLNE